MDRLSLIFCVSLLATQLVNAQTIKFHKAESTKGLRDNYLEKYSILPALCRILDGLPNNKIDNKEIVQLKKFTPPRNFFYYRKKILNRLYSHYYK